jgi:hypothetical protein
MDISPSTGSTTPGDAGGLVGGEERDGGCHLDGVGEAAQRNCSDELLALVRRNGGDDPSLGVGRDGVDGDAEMSELLGCSPVLARQ